MRGILIAGIAVVDAIAQYVDDFPSPGGLRFFERLTLTTGGCAVNCAIALAKLAGGGAECACDVVCRVGNDVLGDFVVAELARHGVPSDGVVRDAKASTSFSFAAIGSSGERRFLHTTGANARLSRADVPPEQLAGRRFMFVAGAMVMDALDGAPTAALLADARQAGAATLLDTVFVEPAAQAEWRRRIGPALPQVDYFVPSLPEARAITGESDPSRMARALQAGGARNVVIKLGDRGALCREAGGRETLVPTFRVQRVLDATGAGDCWCAGFLLGLRDGLPMQEAARLGNAVAAFCIQSPGATTGVPTLAEVRAYMLQA